MAPNGLRFSGLGLVILAALSGRSAVSAFAPTRHATGPTLGSSPASSSHLYMAPRYDPLTQRWEAMTEEDLSDGYGPVGSLIRAGPLPFIQRIINADSYEQAVLKYMSQERCGRREAQGNMDAYFENPNDWAYQKLQEKNGALKRDYANANTDPKQLVLSGTWAGVVVWFLYTFILDCLAGKYAATPGNDLLHGNLWNIG
eukprot:CAMPEP_0183305246 /NCGR_PEP_ID=MMETSP0160_2-20130417/10054_1 /TAXON_ID=2839 ORGANISM="Odontella Sinensis, Strain Grunow 1884" /NCGR_SAMPLE_ID=MMETSP0160_2 /ASSEMBLY_ACC=CAM_ASM_000250 /LENGTH=199 /DNA_ID=CAMNT_0025468421 /DNA_START=107 /DNA_END=706 /DNA_ORIENTATION=+